MSKILIVIPHEDDELAVAGQLIISLKVYQVNKIYVIYTTNGDSYSLDGQIRIMEAIKALKILGVDEDNIIFLGYGNEWKEKHLYNCSGEQTICSKAGKEETYGIEGHEEYIYYKKGKHNKYTRNNFKNDLIMAITDIMPDLLISVDYDSHPDHRATSLFVEECIGEILNKKPEYYPTVWKKFAYLGAWNGPKDYYYHKITLNSKEDKDTTDNPAISWKSRIRLEVPAECKTLKLRKNILYQAALCHRSQNAWLNVQRLCNEDVVYWERKTYNFIRKAQIEVSSGRKECLNDFIITYTADVTKKEMIMDEMHIWHPNDSKKKAFFRFEKPIKATEIVLYESSVVGDNINNILITINDRKKFETGELNHNGLPSSYMLPNEDIFLIELQIIEWEGKLPGLLEVEVIDTNMKKKDLPNGIKFYSDSNEIIKTRLQLEEIVEHTFLRVKAFLVTVLFPNYYVMRKKYKILEDKPIFLPFIWVYQWCRRK